MLICSRLTQYDSTSYNSPLAPMWQIINQLALPLLSLSEGELDDWRYRIRDSVGPTLVHFVESCLDPDLRTALQLQQSPRNSPDIGEGDNSSALPPSYKEAFYGAIRRFIALFIAKPADDSSSDVRITCTQRPLVLFVDDIQWASADDINFFINLLNTDRLAGCMLIFSFRDNDGSEVFLESDLRKKLCKCRYALQTKLLGKQDIYIMLQAMFRQGESEALIEAAENDLRSLAAFLHSQSLGNAQQLRLVRMSILLRFGDHG